MKVTVIFAAEVYEIYKSATDTTPLDTFTEYAELEQYCLDHSYTFDDIEGLDID